MNDAETHSHAKNSHHSNRIRDYVQQLGLIDLGYSGSDTTWSNHRTGDAHVSVRLDRALVNNRWINSYTNAFLRHLVPIASDHSPILLHTRPHSNKHSPFKLYKCWFNFSSCTETINQSWNHQFLGSPSYQFSSKLKYTRFKLQQWKRQSFGNIEENLHSIQSQLQVCHDTNMPATHPQVIQLGNSLQHWLSVQKEYFMQQAGDEFLEADRNTSYFHFVANFNKRRSNINAIQGPLGLWYDSKNEIEQTLLSYFAVISTTSMPLLNQQILQLFSPCISNEENDSLIRLPDAHEIKDVVFNIRPWASPGNDGFQAGFYQHCWDTINNEMGFHSDWLSLIEQCVSTTNISLLINGSPSSTFSLTRGIRQGDPLSPYLFLFIIEAFSRLLQRNVDAGLIQGLKINKHCPYINHLFFADDCLLFFQDNTTQMQHLQQIIPIFSEASGQVINMQKSTIFFGKHTSSAHKTSITGILNMKQMGLGEKYLGIPLLLHRSRQQNCRGILDNMNNRLQGWHNKIVNQAGRTTQVNVVLSTMGMYQMQLFKLPESTIQQMYKIQRHYWFNNFRKKHSCRCIAWEKFFPPPTDTNSSWIWQSICLGLQIILKYAKWQVGNGSVINIWTSNWIPSMLTALQDWNELNISNYQWVSQLVDDASAQWNILLLRQLFTEAQVNSILTIPIQLDQQDILIWPYTTSGIFTTASAYKMLCENDGIDYATPNISPQSWLKFWKLKMPYKYQLFLWKVIHNVLPVRAKLFWHMDNSEKSCSLCHTGLQDYVDHLLLHCPFAQAIWRNFFPHHYPSIMQHTTVVSWVQNWKHQNASININTSIITIHMIDCIMHFIWKHRCRVIFDGVSPNANSVCCQVNIYMSQHHLNIATDNVSHPGRVRSLEHRVWNPPPLNVLKINIDASYNSQDLLAGIGIIVRNHAGKYVMGKATVKRAIDVHQAEAWALLEAMEIVNSNGWYEVVFETYNVNISSYMQSQSSLPP
ncbi:uncharacterized protein LOC113351785 [Papaver somniferum]|uniref:uncharacterized protein LOC113351785 n=1 Tax=Papaver somniferum TaxID=3469 RepID=UPI000E6FFCD1|nr:uncharacterized protein LOC113351785 [Papaver somniferum]